MEFPKYQATYMNGNINLTVRGEAVEEVSDGLRQLLLQARADVAPLLSQTPTAGNGNGGADKKRVKPQNCPGHQFYVATVKKDGANKGRRFRACKNCNHFEWATIVRLNPKTSR